MLLLLKTSAPTGCEERGQPASQLADDKLERLFHVFVGRELRTLCFQRIGSLFGRSRCAVETQLMLPAQSNWQRLGVAPRAAATTAAAGAVHLRRRMNERKQPRGGMFSQSTLGWLPSTSSQLPQQGPRFSHFVGLSVSSGKNVALKYRWL